MNNWKWPGPTLLFERSDDNANGMALYLANLHRWLGNFLLGDKALTNEDAELLWWAIANTHMAAARCGAATERPLSH